MQRLLHQVGDDPLLHHAGEEVALPAVLGVGRRPTAAGSRGPALVAAALVARRTGGRRLDVRGPAAGIAQDVQRRLQGQRAGRDAGLVRPPAHEGAGRPRQRPQQTDQVAAPLGRRHHDGLLVGHDHAQVHVAVPGLDPAGEVTHVAIARVEDHHLQAADLVDGVLHLQHELVRCGLARQVRVDDLAVLVVELLGEGEPPQSVRRAAPDERGQQHVAVADPVVLGVGPLHHLQQPLHVFVVELERPRGQRARRPLQLGLVQEVHRGQTRHLLHQVLAGGVVVDPDHRDPLAEDLPRRADAGRPHGHVADEDLGHPEAPHDPVRQGLQIARQAPRAGETDLRSLAAAADEDTGGHHAVHVPMDENHGFGFIPAHIADGDVLLSFHGEPSLRSTVV